MNVLLFLLSLSQGWADLIPPLQLLIIGKALEIQLLLPARWPLSCSCHGVYPWGGACLCPGGFGEVLVSFGEVLVSFGDVLWLCADVTPCAFNQF